MENIAEMEINDQSVHSNELSKTLLDKNKQKQLNQEHTEPAIMTSTKLGSMGETANAQTHVTAKDTSAKKKKSKPAYL